MQFSKLSELWVIHERLKSQFSWNHSYFMNKSDICFQLHQCKLHVPAYIQQKLELTSNRKICCTPVCAKQLYNSDFIKPIYHTLQPNFYILLFKNHTGLDNQKFSALNCKYFHTHKFSMFWVLQRAVSLRRFFSVPTTYVLVKK